jgi:hypothetical protein
VTAAQTINGVTDKKSSSILIYSNESKVIYTEKVGVTQKETVLIKLYKSGGWKRKMLNEN